MKKTFSSFAVRSLTLGIGAVSNFIVATLLINSFGYKNYADWVILVSLPSLIPFADFGLGSNILNYFADNSQQRETPNNVAEVFFLSALISFLFVLLTTFVFFIISITSLEILGVPNDQICIGLTILTTTFIAVPFSLAAKKMFAEEKIVTVFLIQGLMPPVIAICTFMLLANNVKSIYYYSLIPSITYLITTLIVFKISRITDYFANTNFKKIRIITRKSLILGGWSLCITSVIALIWQVPKYLIQLFGSSQDLTSYSLVSYFLIPGLSIISVSATWHTTNVRRRNLSTDVVVMTKHAIQNSKIAVLFFSIFAFLGIQVFSEVGLVTPDFNSQFIAFAALFSCTTWVIPLSSFTSTLDLRWIAIRIVPCFVVAILILAVLLNFSFDYALLVYVFWLSAAIRYFSIKRLICLKDLQ